MFDKLRNSKYLPKAGNLIQTSNQRGNEGKNIPSLLDSFIILSEDRTANKSRRRRFQKRNIPLASSFSTSISLHACFQSITFKMGFNYKSGVRFCPICRRTWITNPSISKKKLFSRLNYLKDFDDISVTRNGKNWLNSHLYLKMPKLENKQLNFFAGMILAGIVDFISKGEFSSGKRDQSSPIPLDILMDNNSRTTIWKPTSLVNRMNLLEKAPIVLSRVRNHLIATLPYSLNFNLEYLVYQDFAG